MTEKPHSPEQESRPPLSFEQFSHRIKSKFYISGYAPPHYNNFHLIFTDVKDNIYRAGECGKALQKLREENPDLERILTDALTHNAINAKYERPISEYEPQLYEAYLIMRKYVQDDNTLFR